MGASTIVGLLAGGLIALDLRHDGPPAPPAHLTATARTCAPPRCDLVGSAVTLHWSAVTDPAVTALSVMRDGSALADATLPADATGFEDDDVQAGTSHGYAVVATGPGGNATSNTATTEIPLPPLAAAQLRGIYDVTLIVRRASNLSSLSGIRSPRPGERRASTWGFQPLCQPDQGACPTGWTGRAGVVRPRGTLWSGRLYGPEARCADGSPAPSPILLMLRANAAAMVRGVWSVVRFTGTYSVRFHCPGFLASEGAMAVSGSGR